MRHRFFHVQNFTSQGQNGLKHAVTPLFGSSSRGITLHEEDLAFRGIFARAIGQLAGKSSSREGRFSLHHLACFTGSLPGSSCQNHLLHDHLCLPWMLLEIVSDRKSTRLNSSHVRISYAVSCLKKKK